LAIFGRFPSLFPDTPVGFWRHLACWRWRGCATAPSDGGSTGLTTPEAREGGVTARANARWEAIVKNDIDRAYTFLSPASRGATSLEKYKATARRRDFPRRESR